MSQVESADPYEVVDEVELVLEIDDPNSGISLTGKRNEFPEQYTWSLKAYEDGDRDQLPMMDRDIVGEILEQDEDYPQLRDIRMSGTEQNGATIFEKEVPITGPEGKRSIPADEPHSTYKKQARDEARDIAMALRDEYDIEVEIDSDSFYSPEFNL